MSFTQLSSIHRKRQRKPDPGIKDQLEEMKHECRLAWNSVHGKAPIFRRSDWNDSERHDQLTLQPDFSRNFLSMVNDLRLTPSVKFWRTDSSHFVGKIGG